MFKIFVFLLPIIFPLKTWGQNLNSGKIEAKNFCDTIPFEYVRGKIIIHAAINKQRKRFILDTGAPLLISEKLRKNSNAPFSGSGQVTDVTGKTTEQSIATVSDIQIGSLHFKDATGIVYDRKKSGLLDCFDVDGLIGSTILRHCIVQIDLDKKIIILTDKLQFLQNLGSHKTKIRLDANSRPFIRVNLGRQGRVDALFDSGSGKFLHLSKEGFERLKTGKKSGVLYHGYGSISSGLHGPGLPGEESLVMIDEVILGDVAINNIVATVSEHKNKNALGAGLAEYGTITLDYLHKHLYFYPKSPSQTYRSSAFGFEAQLVSGVYAVSALYRNTDAQKMGLQIGSRILKINQYDLTDNRKESICALFLSDYQKHDSIQIIFLDAKGNARNIEIKKLFK